MRGMPAYFVSVCLSTCLPASLPACLPAYFVSVCPSVCQSSFSCTTVHVHVCTLFPSPSPPLTPSPPPENVSQLLRHMFEQHKSSNPIEELVKSAASGDLGEGGGDSEGEDGCH